jgi:DNA-binding transcriptional LysR family regulator
MELNLRGIDLNLLPVFEAAYEERSLSRAALRLAMTQPAMSHAMSRLRHVFKDELFVRHSRGMTPTAAADAIYGRLRGALDSVREVVNEASDFDPAISLRRFFVSIPHPLGPTIALRLLEHLARVAPHFEVKFSTRSRPVDQEKNLRDGRVDIAIDSLLPEDGQFHSDVLFEDRVVAIARAGHPVLERSTSLKNLRAAAFVALRPRTQDEQRFDALRPLRSLNLDIKLEVSELLEILLVVSQSDLLGIMASSMVNVAREALGLMVLEIPDLKDVDHPVSMIWHPRRKNDPAHRFLREQIRAVVSEVVQV